MRQLILSLCIIIALACHATTDNTSVLESRATRAFDNREWASALAIYTLLSEQKPKDVEPYSRAIVAAWMQPDTSIIAQRVELALSRGVPLDSLLKNVERDAFALGDAGIYCGVLKVSADRLPFLRRPIDKALLSYYNGRADGANMVIYARLMLAGRPDDISAMHALAKGYLLCGNTSSALAAYEDILRHDPRDYDALVALATLLHDDPEAAHPLIMRALEIKPSPYLENLLKDSELK
ncbi:MAG: hypothetical protein K2L75_05665 [Muribaculaceae bacterium]|nr:hypothetical protein [Muribaculaceae bacterium]